MRYILLPVIIILLCGTASAAIEDFTTYTEVDSAADLTVTSTKVEIDSMRVDAVSYVRKSYGSGHFGDFEHKYAINLSGGSGGGHGAIWALSNGANSTLTQMDANNTGIVMRIYRGTNYQFKILDYTNDNEDAFDIVDFNIVHYVTVNRSGTSLTYKVYNDSARTDLYKSASITCGVQTYEYVFAVASRNTGGSPTIAGYIENLDLQEATAAPAITAYYPTVTIWPEVNDLQLFNVTVDQLTQCRLYINGSLKQTNSTPSLTHAYTNTSLKGGDWNFTAVVNNTDGTDSKTWLFEVGADSITYVLLQHDPTNQSMIDEINVTRIGSNVTDWGFWENYTFNKWTYYYRYTNGTEIMNQTATSNNESLWFNGTSLLPLGVYFINASAVNTSTIIIPANKYGMVNNWTVATNFSSIAANESNDVCYTYYNVTTGEWDSHYVGYSWNSNYVIPLEASVMMFVDAETTVIAYTVTPINTDLFTGWNMMFIEGTDNETITDIKSDIGANCTDVWYFNSTAGAYSNTSSDTVQPCQGFLGYVTQDFTWTRSDL